MIIIDEFHMVSDASRGYILEHIISKILYCNKKNYCNIRIIGMSATLPNVQVISDWFNGINYICNTRPVKLNEYIIVY